MSSDTQQAVRVADSSRTWFETESVPASADAPTYLDAIRFALEDEMDSDPSVVLLGEDIGVMGGAFRATEGLLERFGDHRVIDTPLAEIAIVGAGIGLAVSGMRPIVELQFADFISCAYDQIVTEAAKLHYRFGIEVPMVVRAPSGGGLGAGPFHSQSPEGIFASISGLKVVCPATIQDAYDSLRWAIADNNPVLYFEHKALYRSMRGELRRHEGTPAQPSPVIRRPGSDVTVVTYGGLLGPCLRAADRLSASGIETEVVDLVLLAPLEMELVLQSLSRTGRLVVVHEDTASAGIGNKVIRHVAERAFWQLDAPTMLVAPPDTPVPFARELESVFIPDEARVTSAIERVVTL